MKEVDRWMLPDGIEEMLPGQAQQVEALRRRLVDVFQSWGYDYVIPPMVEFTDSLLTGSGQDISLLTFKLTDQFSGKTLGVRADITPQVARMDAHSLKRDGVNRLCYSGHVLHTKPKWPLASRSPIQVGVECFGASGIDGDIEVVSLLLSTLEASGLPEQYLDLGHVAIYRALSKAVGFSRKQEVALFELLQAKKFTEVAHWITREVSDELHRVWLLALSKLSGDYTVLDKASEVFKLAPHAVHDAIEQLKAVASVLCERFPNAKLYFDLSELRGYHYLTGLVFGAFSPGVGNAIASGGRYDHIGEAFGRSRSATGFTVDLSAVYSLVQNNICVLEDSGIFAPAAEGKAFWDAVASLRADGEKVICGLSGQTSPERYQVCNRILELTASGYHVKAIDETSE
ncbi:MAG: ATP phosphoribosyltransferase regulatory subunit [Flavobacteriales bacterium]|jgi:ATP phosphoribosyltransferase regulatory subunit